MGQDLFARCRQVFPLDLKAAAAICREREPEECRHILRVADQVCENRFIFDLKCDMEKTSEPVDFGEGPVIWDYMPGGDAEFIYQFNRHRYFICLGQAYQLTGDEKYVRHFLRLLTDWIDTQKLNEQTRNTTWRVLEAGFRGEFWVKAMSYFLDSPLVTEEIGEAFFACLDQQAQWICRMDSPYRYISNWGVIENHGLFEIGLVLPDRKKGEAYMQTALAHLETEARTQILDDGVHWEQSPSYHYEVLHCFLDVLILGKRVNARLPEAVWQGAEAMAKASLAGVKPDGRHFMTGDSDDDSIRDILAKAAWLFGDGSFKTAALPTLDYEAVWELGAEAFSQYQKLEARKPKWRNASLEDSGHYYFRSGWGERDSLLHFFCGTMGAGHGHSDKLHVDLCALGEDVLTDSGRFTYVDGPDRKAFKDPAAHNTIVVDQEPFTVYKDSWECSKLCRAIRQPMKQKEGYALAQGGHLGYLLGESKGCMINRKVLSLSGRLYVIADECYGTGRHLYQQYWHFSERGRVRLLEKKEDCVQGLFEGGNVRADFTFLAQGIRPVLEKSRISRFYNSACLRDSLVMEQEKQGFASFLTVIGIRESGKGQRLSVRQIPVSSALKGIVYPPNMAQALEIKGNGADFVVIICHQEVNSPTDLTEAGGCMGYGDVIVFDRNRSLVTGAVMSV